MQQQQQQRRYRPILPQQTPYNNINHVQLLNNNFDTAQYTNIFNSRKNGNGRVKSQKQKKKKRSRASYSIDSRWEKKKRQLLKNYLRNKGVMHPGAPYVMYTVVQRNKAKTDNNTNLEGSLKEGWTKDVKEEYTKLFNKKLNEYREARADYENNKRDYKDYLKHVNTVERNNFYAKMEHNSNNNETGNNDRNMTMMEHASSKSNLSTNNFNNNYQPYMMQPPSSSSLNNNNTFSQNPSWGYSQNYNLMPSDGASSSSTMLNKNNIVDSTTTNMQNLLQRENSNTLSFADASYFSEKALSTGSSGSTSRKKSVMPIIKSRKLSPTSRKNKDKVNISQPILFMDSNSSKQEVLNQLLNYLYQNEKVNREWVTYRKKMLVQFEKKQGANRPGSPYILFTMDARVKHKAKHSGTGTPALNLPANDLSKMWATVQPDVK